MKEKDDPSFKVETEVELKDVENSEKEPEVTLRDESLSVELNSDSVENVLKHAENLEIPFGEVGLEKEQNDPNFKVETKVELEDVEDLELPSGELNNNFVEEKENIIVGLELPSKELNNNSVAEFETAVREVTKREK